MVLNVRQKQTDAVVRMLHLNAPPAANGRSAAAPASEEEYYKVLVLDAFTKDVLAPLLRVNDLRRHGITLHLLLESERQPIPDVPAVYFVRGGEAAVDAVAADAAKGLYDAMHLNFAPGLPPPQLERLAGKLVSAGAAHRIAKVFDQYLAFAALESGLFSLAQPHSYLALNDPAAKDTDVEAAVSAVVDGLFAVLATMGVVPIIRCPKGGAAEAVAAQLEARLRAALKSRANPFSEAAPALAGQLGRPLLALFDRSFELSVALQHSWTYAPMVADVLGMSLNRVSIPSRPEPGAPAAPPKSYEVHEGDFFWDKNARQQWPSVAEDQSKQLAEYREAIAEINRTTGAGINPDAVADDMQQSQTAGLMAAVSSLPALRERKRVIDKHTNMLTAILDAIKARGLDAYYHLEEACLGRKATLQQVADAVQGQKGTAMDRLRLVLVYLLTAEALPSEDELRPIQTALQAAGADLAALAYVRRMRRMNLAGSRAAAAPSAPAAPAADGLAASWGLNWADKTFGQGLSSLTKGVKNLLAGEQQAAVTVAVEALMDAKPEAEAFATFDPKAAPGRPARPPGPSREAIVFMIGGGSYLERESLATWAGRAAPPKSVVYGATELLTGEAFASQLAELGRRSGAA